MGVVKAAICVIVYSYPPKGRGIVVNSGMTVREIAVLVLSKSVG